jgi:serine/threonine protein kinase
MTAPPAPHPSPDLLRALAAGNVEGETARRVLAHLEACPDCCLAMTTIGGNGLLNRLRAAETTPSGATLGPGAAAGPVENIPPELRDHPDFEVLRKLGGGGMGVVYLARDRLTHRQEVLKVVNPYLATQPGVAERFLREIRAVVQLLHPNIVTAYGAMQVGGLLVLKMEYVPGEDLSTVVKAGGPLPVVNACYYAQQVALGLHYAFGKGMVHRDIKPGNLILAREGNKHTVKILDFGLVKAMAAQGATAEHLTLTAQGMGTPAFMAPEQARDAARADIRADIYSLGCTLYYLLTGRPPFPGMSAYDLYDAHRSTLATPLDRVREDVPAKLAAVVAKMLAKAPVQRYQEPAEVAQALQPFVKAVLKSLPAVPPPAEGAREREIAVPVEGHDEAPPITASRDRTVPGTEVTPPMSGGKARAAGARKSAASGGQRNRTYRRTTWRVALMMGLTMVLLAVGVGLWLSGLFRPGEEGGISSNREKPLSSEAGWPVADLGRPYADLKDDLPRVGLALDDRKRFGLVLPKERDPSDPGRNKRLTYDEKGSTNNTCLKVDSKEYLFGNTGTSGKWVSKEEERGNGRVGWDSTWEAYNEGIVVKQSVDLVPGEQSRLLDTVLVRYTITNQSDNPHTVALRVMLDTFIGANDGVPFAVPGSGGKKDRLVDTIEVFDRKDIPDFIQALERPDLKDPGTVAILGLKLRGFEPLSKMVICRWPGNNEYRWPGEGEYEPMRGKDLKPDSCVFLFWADDQMNPGGVRKVAFTYGLNTVSGVGGKVALTSGGNIQPGGEFTVMAYVKDAENGQSVRLGLPPGFSFAEGQAPVKRIEGISLGIVSWRVKAPNKAGEYVLEAEYGDSRTDLGLRLRGKKRE